jgi:hypothetical protein
MKAEKQTSWWNTELRECDRTPQDRRNQQRVVVLLFFWMVSFVALSILIREGNLQSGPLAWGAVGVSTVLGVAMLLAYRRFLSETDELQRRIQLESLAWGFGGGFVAVYSAHLLDRLGAIEGELAVLGGVMAFFYFLGLVVSHRRYR